MLIGVHKTRNMIIFIWVFLHQIRAYNIGWYWTKRGIHEEEKQLDMPFTDSCRNRAWRIYW